MAWRYRRSKMFGPLRLTATRSGLALSAGSAFGRVSVNSRGEVRQTTRVPGVGLYETKKVAQLGHPHPKSGARCDHPHEQSSEVSDAAGVEGLPAPAALPAWYPDPSDERLWR